MEEGDEAVSIPPSSLRGDTGAYNIVKNVETPS